ncbi:TonB-dependent receptor [Elongatibacter sediminis]|uniref:TonB-dependent receptor n=1 Tax=Elongatibacter sediminis TaxID=3119006 RepID=A0AAW9R9X0_9GAMM
MNSNRQVKRNTLSAAITTALLATGQAGIAAAQEQAGSESAGGRLLEEIVVTAQRREQSIVDIPYNISAVSGEFIDDGFILETSELLRSVPGAAVVDIGHRNTGVVNTIRIRGLTIDSNIVGDFSLSTVPTVSTYLNDTPVFANFILKDLERVEVLRGPQGTLYGSGSLGGTVRYIARRPVLGEWEGMVEGHISDTKGSSGTNWGASAVINIPLGDTFAARIVAGKIDNDGVVDLPNVYVLDNEGIPVAPDGPLADTAVYESIEDADTVDIEYARVSLAFEPNDKFDALLTWTTQDDDIGGRMHPTNGLDGWGDPYDDYEAGSIQREPSEREVDLVSLEMNIDLGFATLTSSTSGYEHSGSSTSENTGFYAQLGWLGAFYYNYPRPMASAVRTYDDEAFIQELRLVSNGDGMFDWVVGAYYADEDKFASQDSFLRGFKNWADAAWGCCVISDQDFRYRRDENFEDKALFGELTWNISETFRITGGFRSFDHDYKNTTNMGVGLYTSFSFDDTVEFSDSDSDTLFKFNASWDIHDRMMAYGTISEGYRRGGTNAVPLSGVFAEDPVWQRYGPDTVTNYEIGIKGTGDQSFYNISLFYVDWEDIQLNTATTNWAFFAAQNAEDAHTAGLEAEFDFYFGQGWHANLGYAYVSGELDNDFFAADDPNQTSPIAREGTKLPGLSEHTLNATVDHAFNLSNGWEWRNRITGYWQSEMENSVLPSPRFNQTLDDFAIVDFSSTLAINHWAVTLFVKNLFNEDGIVGVFKEQYMGTDPAQNYFGNGSKELISRPRTVGVNLRYDF